jgi:hypothetical protein
MKCFLPVCAFLLAGCTSTPPASETLTEGIKKDIQALEKSLPKECQTESVKLQFAALETKVDATLAVCENEKALLEEEKRHKDTWLGVWFTVSLMLLVLYARKVLRF